MTSLAIVILRDVMRTIHVLAGGVWIGGSVVYLLAIGPALRLAAHNARQRQAQALAEGEQTNLAAGRELRDVSATIASLFRRLVNISMGALLISGVYLIFDRLTTTTVGVAYIVTLVAKVALALAMFGLAIFQAQEARRPAAKRSRLWSLAPRLILYLGIVVFLLGAVLTGLFESALVGVR
ncbi:MAG TPA: hypothetical protein VMV29_21970 [Ktedonobacterales bacterium]|nr:hypothetical protein [Ktedonobacterales bacterium]HUY79453.1 hypothetical protein [Ktedonobacterales bacterium]